GEEFKAPILLAQHLSARFSEGFVRFLRSHTDRSVRLCESRVELAPNMLIVAAPELHMELESLSAVRPRAGAAVHGNRPSVSVLMHSAARVAGAAAAGVMLSGMGEDGADGLLAMREAGALTGAEFEPAVDGMPRAAREIGAVSFNESIVDLALRLNEGRR
ncbi:MAG: chemotaxis protein CheB, partial [Myxococcota bacterium]